MSQQVEEVLSAALALPAEDQVELVEALIATIDRTDTRPFDDSWLLEARRRSDELAAGTVTPLPWPEVKERARRGAGGDG